MPGSNFMGIALKLDVMSGKVVKHPLSAALFRHRTRTSSSSSPGDQRNH
jgi:hypothetical protein